MERLEELERRWLRGLDREIVRILEKALEGEDITVEEGTRLLQVQGMELHAVVLVADELRRRRVGDVVTYVINRNINFTNVCIKHCGFCAFSRDHREEEGYFLPVEEVVRRAWEAWELGATEVRIQAGLPPQMDGGYYVELVRAIKREVPGIHVHAFSPEEVVYGAVRAGCSVEAYLGALKEAGLESLPGTAAEILDDEVRRRISPGRISTAQWVEVITTAHRLGIPTTATIMYGHVETERHRAAHLALIRDIQRETGGFTEFIPLSFVHEEAPMWRKRLVAGVRPGPTGVEVVKMYAVCRIMLNNWIPNLQVSWVKEGPKLAQVCLNAGGNDFMGTLINESISTAAGARYGQRMRPREMRRLIRDMGRIPAERTTTYQIRRLFPPEEDDHYDPLDLVEEGEDRFGSYLQLVHSSEYRFRELRQQVQRGPAGQRLPAPCTRTSSAE
ncbi:MAG: 5-amino-6-(D-ribitylamino)uracil--L-tyrosine 4-hydroxyphenyl transferase CofH [Armatimonadota bacterium]|nr:5-amino-6-(D-ribitylamino)uracil--L-tyrosine 4-hydroxyphenyl transferase CofH [Armatimonadota bacterium]